jgi:hypothetical protein
MQFNAARALSDPLIDSTFGSPAMQMAADTKRFPPSEMRADVAYQIVHDELLLDGNARQNLATFCQTWDDENVHKLMDVSINKNWIDKEEYPQSAAISLKCVNMIADLWNAPKSAGNATGTNTIGSSEACMLGGMAMKWRWRAKQKALGKPTDKPNFVCGPVQVCWHKFARYWDVEIREIPMEPGRLFMDPERMLEAVDENEEGPRYRHPCRRGERRVSRAVLRPRDPVGFPASAGEVDQFVGPQVRPGAARLRLGHLARSGVAAGRPCIQSRLPWRAGRHLRNQLLAARRPGHLICRRYR